MLYAKALVPLLMTPVLFLLETVGVTPDMTIEQAVFFIINAALTAVLVYLIPNKQA